MAEPLLKPGFSLNDLTDHVDNYGVDIFPPIDISKETVRAQSFFLELRDRWPRLFENVTVGGAEFRMQTTFLAASGKHQVPFMTFNLTSRGPVFAFPRRLAGLGGEVDLRAEPESVFKEAFQLFLRTFPGRQALRMGLVRALVFNTGQTDCTPWLGGAVVQFDTAHLVAASCILLYVEDECNIRMQLDPSMLFGAMAVVPGAGAIPGQNQFGLSVTLDVNSRDMRPMTPDDIETVLRKANAVWPDRFIRFLNERSWS